MFILHAFLAVVAITPFFSSLDDLQSLTLNLQAHPDRFVCHNCQRSEHFVSHGFSYVKARAAQRVTVGKRLFCADRFGRGGCGATLRLYLFDRVPRLHANATALQAFLAYLDQGMAVESAYAQSRLQPQARIVPRAVPQLEKTTPPLLPHRSPRNAWRWLKKLDRNLPRFRALLAGPAPEQWLLMGRNIHNLVIKLGYWTFCMTKNLANCAVGIGAATDATVV